MPAGSGKVLILTKYYDLHDYRDAALMTETSHTQPVWVFRPELCPAIIPGAQRCLKAPLSDGSMEGVLGVKQAHRANTHMSKTLLHTPVLSVNRETGKR